MRKSTKIWIIIASFLVISGMTIFSAVMLSNDWDFTKLSTVKYETNTYDISEDFNDIFIESSNSDIIFLPSDNGECKIVCFEAQKIKHSVLLENGTLTLKEIDERKWYEYIGIFWGNSKITVYLPKSEYDSLMIRGSTGDVDLPDPFKFENIDIHLSTGDIRCFASASDRVKIRTSTGDVYLENVFTDSLEISVSTGDIVAKNITSEGDITIEVSTGDSKLTDINCKSFISTGTTGDITMQNVIASEKFSIKRDTGYVKFDRCDATEILIKTSTGDVKGSLLSEKVFITDTSTGSVKVPGTTSGGKCEITTSTGDIKITIEQSTS